MEKSFNLRFIKEIIKYERFYKDLKNYIENFFIPECLKEMKIKLKSILLKWESKFKLFKNQENFLEYI